MNDPPCFTGANASRTLAAVWLLPRVIYGLFISAVWVSAVWVSAVSADSVHAGRPNVVLIVSDDQGGGDYGFMGNDLIRTPQLDAMNECSGRLTNFYVSPVCGPTRASLMTGRYNYRTRCVDTYVGRAMMDSGEVTLAELLRDAGYRTGIYGKWHLGDNYPLRAMDQGFQDSLVHRGGGIGQPSDPIGAEGKYTDPTLFKNGNQVQRKGYCTDIFFDEAMDFIAKSVDSDAPFFTYIATNAPHGPFHDVPNDLYEQYRNVDFAPIMVGKVAPKRMDEQQDKLARIAAMITNIDQNVGRLFSKLDDLGIRENTIVVYLNDNGPNSKRYVGDMRGSKSNVDDGGIRSPLLFHWPEKVDAGTTANELCAHIDVLPTILDACDVELPANLIIDGRSFLPLMTGRNAPWPTRQLVIQSHRGDVPQRYHHFALHENSWKLVHPSGFGKESFEGECKYQLYDLSLDPKQQRDLASQHPNVVKRLANAYAAWFDDVSSTRPDNFDPPRIIVGTPNEPTTVLTRQDWRHTQGKPWAVDSNGHWLLESNSSGRYEVEVFMNTDLPTAQATINAGSFSQRLDIPAGKRTGNRTVMQLPSGQFTLAVDVVVREQVQGPHQVSLKRIDD
ncbi:Arylsulfatase [Rubripirellula amarantea]|uniref:Arylsulfatase n=1 Tax=Rubripirellula amarantea TaxID=2527999 RepID=A0A5C5WTH2_9BACT|nr:arylsulfatase [Rubripirellula amarantea]TWT53451.1 Arylsulfatase [Rubripirellula amarantea]